MAKNIKTAKTGDYILAVIRLMLGFVFLWAFFDKTFGLGKSTPSDHAWINGGSPTSGFLSVTKGPFADLFHNLAGQPWVDWLFMLGLLGIGLGLLFGIAQRLTAFCGVILLILMWAAVLPIATNPFIDDHLVYAAVLILIAVYPNQKWSLSSWWKSQSFVKSNKWLW